MPIWPWTANEVTRSSSSTGDRARTMGLVWEHGDTVRRREFITGVGATAVVGARGAWGQQAVPIVGFLHPSSPEPFGHIINGFRLGLNDSGFVEGQNVTIEYRWARGDYDQLPALAVDLVQRRVRVILAGGGEVGALAAKAATSTIPILIIASNDPVKSGLVASFNGRAATSRV